MLPNLTAADVLRRPRDRLRRHPAEDGLVAEETIAALGSFRQSGRKLILVSGRELPDLWRVLRHLDLFDAAVVENGACSRIKETVEHRYIKPA